MMRRIVLSVACLGVAWALTPIGGGRLLADERAEKSKKEDKMKELRKQAAHRKRRIIFNNDGDDVVYECKTPTAEELLKCRTTPLLGSQVDTIFYCTWCSGFSYFTHRTKVGQIFDCTANPVHPDNKTGGLSRNKTADFVKQGTDPLEIMVGFCRKNNIEIFWSFRMNDTHDAWGSWYGDLLFPQVKKDHPEWLVGSKMSRPKHGGWSAVDYGRPEIRDLAVKFIAEVCENYDVDGIEMDFCRHPLYFKTVAWGHQAGAEELGQMTDMVQRVRQVTEQTALKRGHPMLVAIRVPDSADYCKGMGLDIVRWLEEDLVDLLSVSDYFRLNPWEVSVQLGHKYDVPVYPCLSESRVNPDHSKLRHSPQCYRARAMNAWNSGADGVYLFNLFNPRSPVWRELGDPKALEKLDKVYFVSVRGSKSSANPNFWLEDGKRFDNLKRLSPDNPLPLKAGEKQVVSLSIGDNVLGAKNEGIAPELKLRLLAALRHAQGGEHGRTAKLTNADDLAITLNGKPLSGGVLSQGWLEYLLPPELVVKGQNNFEILLKPESKEAPVLQDLLVWVRYKKGE